MSVEGIVVQVKSSPFLPTDRIVFMKDYWHPEIQFPEDVDGVIIVVPAGQPLLYELASSLIGHRVDAAGFEAARRRSVGQDSQP